MVANKTGQRNIRQQLLLGSVYYLPAALVPVLFGLFQPPIANWLKLEALTLGVAALLHLGIGIRLPTTVEFQQFLKKHSGVVGTMFACMLLADAMLGRDWRGSVASFLALALLFPSATCLELSSAERVRRKLAESNAPGADKP